MEPKVVNVKFKGYSLEYVLELRAEPGALIAMGWLDDARHEAFHEEYEERNWEDFHRITGWAFEGLGDRTAWINAETIEWLREL